MADRKAWIDQTRGLSIFLVVYGHNFPAIEPYIYSFHVPLFFFIAGMFHPKKVDLSVVSRRAKMILVPYFVWATLLFLFWFFVGKDYGKTSDLQLSVVDNLVGIFYAQGGQQYMSWGIPLWFLPCIFLVFLIASALGRIKTGPIRKVTSIALVVLGFLWPELTGIHLPWSLDVALVALAFYISGGLIKEKLFQVKGRQMLLLLLVLLGVHVLTHLTNFEKVDMYRSIYGNPLLFLVSGLTGSIFYILFFKWAPFFKVLEYIGKHTIVILATHIRALTVIKLIIFLAVGTSVFQFSEAEKLILAIAQIIIVIPVIWLVGKFVPILDGKVSKS